MAVSADLTGKIALVTGATSGLGWRFAEVLARNGARVVITGRRLDRLETLREEIEAAGGTALAIALDVCDLASIEACVATAENKLGPIDILVNNSGVGEPAPATDITEALYDRVMNTNAKGAFFVAQAVGKQMIAHKIEGRIINIASMAAHKVLAGLSVYCMSKAAVAHMTRALAKEWARFGINVNAICPGYIDTEINHAFWETEQGKGRIAAMPRRRVGVPADLDAALLMLAAPEARFITGAMIDVEDAQSL